MERKSLLSMVLILILLPSMMLMTGELTSSAHITMPNSSIRWNRSSSQESLSTDIASLIQLNHYPGITPSQRVSERYLVSGESLPSVKDWAAPLPSGPLTGTKKILVILVDFSDHEGTQSPAHYQDLLFGGSQGSMNHYYSEVSYGLLDVIGVTAGAGWYRSAQNEDWWGDDSSSGGIDDANQFIFELAREAVILADADVDFKSYDANNDDILEPGELSLAIVHAGSGQEMTGNEYDIWSHRWYIFGEGYTGFGGIALTDTFVDGVRVSKHPDDNVGGYFMQAEDSSLGVFAHEFGHDLGLPDLYDTDYSSDGVGVWSLMGSGSWLGTPVGSSPAHLDAWSKVKLGWIDPTVVDESYCDAVITNAETLPIAYKLLYSSTEFFLVENRQKIGYDSFLPGAGVLIWHIDESMPDNDDETHKMVDLEEAHGGVQHLDFYGEDTGGLNDPYSNDYSFTWGTDPNNIAYKYGMCTGCSATDISLSGYTMMANLEAWAFVPGPYLNGSQIDQIYFKMYWTTVAEWEGVKNNEIDLMGETLTRSQYNEWINNPVINQAIELEEERDLGMFQFDINCNATCEGLEGGLFRKPGVLSPTGDPLFRAAVAKLIDKTAIARDFAGQLEILDVPAIPPLHNAFINPAVIGANYAFQYDGAQAQLDLDEADYDQVIGVDNPYVGGPLGYLENYYPWAVPYMRRNALTGNLISEDFDWGGGVRGLVIYSCADLPELAKAGRRLRDVLRAAGIPVNYREVDRTTCNRQVMYHFSYHFYTGSWRMSRDPDHLHDFYTSEFANPYDCNYMLFNGQGPRMDYPFTVSQAYEDAIDDVKYAPTRDDMITAAKDIQAKLWGPSSGWFAGCGGMPSIILGHYQPIWTAYRKGWRGIVNEQGQGVRSWWSTMFGHHEDASVSRMRFGLGSCVESLNPVVAQLPQDYMVMDRIYDFLIRYNPLNVPSDVPCGLALSWNVGTWGAGLTQVKFTLRSDLKWHPNGAITFPEDEGGDGQTEPANPSGAALTVDDVAFSWLYHQAQWGWSYSSVYLIQEVQTRNGPPEWPMDALEEPGGLTAMWTANPALAADEVVALMTIQGFLSLHWIGEVYILPMFIWRHVLDAYAFEPIVRNAVIGSGPYKLNTYMPDVSVLLDANRNYFLSTGSGGSATYSFREEAHRRGDAGSITGSGPKHYDGKIDAWDLAYFISVFSATAYTDYPMPNYWRDDVYHFIQSPPIPPWPEPYDGFGQESMNGVDWGPVIAYPWRVRNPGAGPAYIYADFDYDRYVNAFDLLILGVYWGTDVGSGW